MSLWPAGTGNPLSAKLQTKVTSVYQQHPCSSRHLPLSGSVPPGLLKAEGDVRHSVSAPFPLYPCGLLSTLSASVSASVPDGSWIEGLPRPSVPHSSLRTGSCSPPEGAAREYFQESAWIH